MHILSLALVLANAAANSHALSTFQANCSVTPHTVNYVSSPNTRGTLDILWSCLFTILACTWTILHLNIPEQRNDQDPGKLGDIRWAWKGFWRSAKWMLVTVIAPELILGKAFEEWCYAIVNAGKMAQFAAQDGVEWTLAHSFFANMGGFVVRFLPTETGVEPEDDLPLEPQGHMEQLGNGSDAAQASQPQVQSAGDGPHPATPPISSDIELQNLEANSGQVPATEGTGLLDANTGRPSTSEEPTSSEAALVTPDESTHVPISSSADAITPKPEIETTRHAYFTAQGYTKGQKVNEGEWTSNFYSMEEIYTNKRAGPALPVVPLDADDLLWLRQENKIPKLPDITASEIADKSKSSAFVKAIAVAQILWVMIQMIVRSARGLPSSQLEVATAAFALCSCVTYGLLFAKPQNVAVPMRPLSLDARVLTERWDLQYEDSKSAARMLLPVKPALGDRFHWKALPNDHVKQSTGLVLFIVGVSVGGMIFGAVHVAAWNFSFPTWVDEMLWRVASLSLTLTVAAIAFGYLCAAVIPQSARVFKDVVMFAAIFAMFLIEVLYVASRGVLLVVMFRTLAYLPPEAYVSTWTAEIPHLA